jgi:hypothetical protein
MPKSGANTENTDWEQLKPFLKQSTAAPCFSIFYTSLVLLSFDYTMDHQRRDEKPFPRDDGREK